MITLTVSPVAWVNSGRRCAARICSHARRWMIPFF
jgi:hypothetical protein